MPPLQSRPQQGLQTASDRPTRLAFHWEDQFYLDISIPFSLRHSASAGQRTTEAVSAIAKEEVGADTVRYIDDTIGAPIPESNPLPAHPGPHDPARPGRSPRQVSRPHHHNLLDRSGFRHHPAHHGDRPPQGRRNQDFLPRAHHLLNI